MKSTLATMTMMLAAPLMLGIWLVPVCVQAQTDTPKPGPELQKLEVFVGDWTYKGEQVDPPVPGLPYGPEGRFEGKFTTRFVLDGFFQQHTLEDRNPAGVTRTILMVGYDAKAETYIENEYLSDGTRSVATATFDGRIWTSNSTMTTGDGQNLLVKTVTRYSPDWASYTSATEISVDNGKTWKHWFKVQGKKVKN